MPADLLSRAHRAATPAELLLEDGDIDGACNRAYYAMYDAARAALLAAKAPVDPNVIRTHNGLIAAFGLHLVKPGLINSEMGRTFNRAQEIRQAADYTNDQVDVSLAIWAVERSAWFIEAVREAFQIDGPALAQRGPDHST